MALSTAVTLAIVECGAHALVAPYTLDELLVPSAVAGLRVEPRPNADLVFEGLTVKIPESRVRTDARGVRHPVPAEPRARDARRLVCLGDSVVFGWGVEDEQAFCPLLAARLGPGWEALNLGVPSYNLVQTVLRYASAEWAATHVVLLLNANDLDAVVNPLHTSAWVRHSALVRWVASRLARKSAAESWTVPPRDEAAGRAARKRLRQLLERRGVGLTVALAHRPVPALRAALAGVSVVDVSDVLRQLELVIPGDGHPNAAGHRALADRLAQHAAPASPGG